MELIHKPLHLSLLLFLPPLSLPHILVPFSFHKNLLSIYDIQDSECPGLIKGGLIVPFCSVGNIRITGALLYIVSVLLRVLWFQTLENHTKGKGNLLERLVVVM